MRMSDAGRVYDMFIVSDKEVGRVKEELTLDVLYRHIGCKVLCTFVRYIGRVAYRIFANDDQTRGRITVSSDPPIRGNIVILGARGDDVRRIDDFDELIIRDSLRYTHVSGTPKDSLAVSMTKDATDIVAVIL